MNDSNSMLICGLMTGTSLDGIDCALAKFSVDSKGKHQMEIISSLTDEMPFEIKDKISSLIVSPDKVHISDISMLNFALPKLFDSSIRKLCSESGTDIADIVAVGMHGQTIWHDPTADRLRNMSTASTLQIASASVLSALSGTKVVADFRSADIALGGQGAPHVPIFDYNFLSCADEDIITLNIGGISNITIMPAGCSEEEISAFDTGPGNTLIDYAMRRAYGREYDRDGKIARSGFLIPDMLEELMSLPYIKSKPPKSTGRELFNPDLIRQFMLDNRYLPEDIVRTLTEYTALTIAENIKIFASEKATIIASGGGIRNLFLKELLNEKLPDSKIVTSDEYGIEGDTKEALCFAYLAYRRLLGLHGNVQSVTGASGKVLCGIIADSR
jgi:anhydro-N-acetylmuramic acid kinase